MFWNALVKQVRRVVPIFHKPDLSCDVDFSVLARLAKLNKTKSDSILLLNTNSLSDPTENTKIETYGPVTQEHFLTEMGH